MSEPRSYLKERMASIYFEVLDENGEVVDTIQSDPQPQPKLRAKRPQRKTDG